LKGDGRFTRTWAPFEKVHTVAGEASAEDIIETFYSCAGSRQKNPLHRSSLLL
jgi:hypothetical protein